MKKNPQMLLRFNAIGMIVGLTLQYILGMITNLFVEFPKGGNEGQLWVFAWHQIPLALHIILGLLLLLGSVILIIRSYLIKNRSWVISSVVGFIGIITAVYGGVSFIPTQTDSYSFIMSAGFIVSLLAYAWGIYVSKNN